MKGVILAIVLTSNLTYHPLLNLARTGEFSTNDFTSLLVPVSR